MRIADVGREELEETHASALAGGSDERWHYGRADRNQPVHEITAGKHSKPAAIET